MSTQPRSATLPACGYEGNSDVYGLGIRVGIYLQWFSGLLSKAFLEEKELRDVLNENAIFLFAIFLATILLVTDTISGVHSVDILIMLHIFFGSIYTIFVDEHIIARIEYFSSLIGILFKSGIATGMAAIGVWFWFYDTPIPSGPECSQYAFLFSRVGFYSRSTIMAFKAFATINLFLCSSVLLGTISVRIEVWIFKAFLASKLFPSENPDDSTTRSKMAIKVRRWILSGIVPSKTDYYEQFRSLEMQTLEEFQEKARCAHRKNPDGPISKLLHSFEFTTKLLKFLDWPTERILAQQQKVLESSILGEKYPGLVGLFAVERRYNIPETKVTKKKTLLETFIYAIQQTSLLAANIAIMIYSIINIELLIRYNNISGVYTLLSTGQIIPFIIGVESLWRTCWQIITDNVEHEIECQLAEKEKEEGTGSCTKVASRGLDDDSFDKAEHAAMASGAFDTAEGRA